MLVFPGARAYCFQMALARGVGLGVGFGAGFGVLNMKWRYTAQFLLVVR